MSGSFEGKVLEDVPSFEEFQAKVSGANLVGIASALAFDHETAIGLAQRFQQEEQFFLLESATEGPKHLARYSFMGFGVTDLHELTRDGRLQSFSQRSPSSTNPITQVSEAMEGYHFAYVAHQNVNMRDVRPEDFVGAVGFYSYDIASMIEPSVGELLPARLGTPLVRFVLPEVFMILDQLRRQLIILTIDKLTEGQERPTYQAAIERLSRVHQQINKPHSMGSLQKTSFAEREPDEQTLSKEDFLKKAADCREQIKAGEIFQIQIGNRKSYRTNAAPFDIFRNLRMLNPSPYMFYYRFGEDHVFGASPEMMVTVSGGHITERPIAGTRKRTWQAERDQSLVDELVASEKERAEHVMLVDLCRNDIGRVAQPGSVVVDDLMVVEEYSHVFHLVSQVQGRLRAEQNSFDALSASFPNGTVSGAPKVRAMQLINQYEDCAREFYAGCLGIHTFAGDLRSTITIRAIHYRNGVASTQASAGIVWDSNPEHEWLETRNKMAATVEAILTTAPRMGGS